MSSIFDYLKNWEMYSWGEIHELLRHYIEFYYIILLCILIIESGFLVLRKFIRDKKRIKRLNYAVIIFLALFLFVFRTTCRCSLGAQINYIHTFVVMSFLLYHLLLIYLLNRTKQ